MRLFFDDGSLTADWQMMQAQNGAGIPAQAPDPKIVIFILFIITKVGSGSNRDAHHLCYSRKKHQMAGEHFENPHLPGSAAPEGASKEDALRKYRRQYLPLRKAKDDSSQNERLLVKSEIADDINRGDQTLQEHFKKLDERLRRKGTTGQAFAAGLSDGNSQTEPREPSLVEAVLTTAELDKLYQGVAENFKDRALAVIRIGSAFWGRNYSVRSKERANASDLDLEIVVKDIQNDLPYLDPEITQSFQAFKENFNAGQADYFVFKKVVEGYETSFHVMPMATLKKICTLDYADIDTPAHMKEFRAIPGLKSKVYHLKNFAGDLYRFETSPIRVDGGQISEVPIVTIGNHGEIALGVVVSKYIPLPEVTGLGGGDIRQEIGRMIGSLQQRRRSDAARLPGKDLSFVLSHVRASRMPQWIKADLKKLDI